MKKKFSAFLLLIILVIGTSSSSAFAPASYEPQTYCVEWQIYCVERQTELLHELQELLRSPDFSQFIPFASDGAPIEIPNINMIIPPFMLSYSEAMEYSSRHDSLPLPFGTAFMIGLDIDIGNLGYNDQEAIEELTRQNPPEEVIDFILSFAGIPRHLALVTYSVTMTTPRGSSDDIHSIRDNVWNSDIDNELISYDDLSLNPRFVDTIRMGQLDYIPGFNYGTIGHPFNGSDGIYMTSVHATGVNFRTVYLNNFRHPNPPIGFISNSIVTSSIDVARISLQIPRISSELPGGWHWPSGNRIRNYRGTPRVWDTVRSIRGRSGVTESVITYINMNTGTWTNKIITYPNGHSLTGDSGSALIRVSDSAVLGTRRGRATLWGHSVGVYTSVLFY